MHKQLKDLACWYLAKYHPATIAKIAIGTKTLTVDFSGFLPKNSNNWHSFSTVIRWFAKNGNPEPKATDWSIEATPTSVQYITTQGFKS